MRSVSRLLLTGMFITVLSACTKDDAAQYSVNYDLEDDDASLFFVDPVEKALTHWITESIAIEGYEKEKGFTWKLTYKKTGCTGNGERWVCPITIIDNKNKVAEKVTAVCDVITAGLSDVADGMLCDIDYEEY